MNIDRVAFNIFGIEIYWYAIFIIVGMLLGIHICAKEAKRRGWDEDIVYDFMILAIPIAILGARLYYVAFEWDQYGGDIAKILDIRSGGLAIHGGLLAAVIVGIVYGKRKKINFFELADICMPGVAMGQAIGRWGNFVNQEAHGGETTVPWAILVDGKSVHPTFLYESIGDFIICFFLLYYAQKHQKNRGEIFMLYMILYGALRFFVEGFRTDSLMFLNLRVAQLVSLVGVVIGVLGFIFIRKKHK